jgi:hypothetical protein
MRKLPNHLGGHKNITHIDSNTLIYLKNKYNILSMYDLGCGPGGMLVEAQKLGINSAGIDGDFTIKYPKGIKIYLHDFTKGRLFLPKVDLVWCCEFLEHVAEEFVCNYFEVLQKSRVVCCTFSTTTKGHNHVNVKNQEYWDDQFMIHGFNKDIESTNYIRKNSSMRRDFIRNTGTVYINVAS